MKNMMLNSQIQFMWSRLRETRGNVFSMVGKSVILFVIFALSNY